MLKELDKYLQDFLQSHLLECDLGQGHSGHWGSRSNCQLDQLLSTWQSFCLSLEQGLEVLLLLHVQLEEGLEMSGECRLEF